MEKVKEIAEEYGKNGLTLKFLERHGGIALFSIGRGNKVFGYEVHKVRKFPYPARFGNDFGWTHYEALAGNEEFGAYGWHYQTLDAAQQKIKALSV